MPNRTIKDSIRTSRSLAVLNAEEFRHFILLMVLADDFGRFDANPAVLRGFCYSLHDTAIATEEVERWTNRLADPDVGIVELYTVEDGRIIGSFINWKKYQQKRAMYSKFPPPLETANECDHQPASSNQPKHPPEHAPENRESRIENRENENRRIENRGGNDPREQTTTTIKPNVQDFFKALEKAYEEQIEKPRGIVIKEMRELADAMRDAPSEWGPKAVDEAVRGGPDKKNWRYIKAILVNWGRRQGNSWSPKQNGSRTAGLVEEETVKREFQRWQEGRQIAKGLAGRTGDVAP